MVWTRRTRSSVEKRGCKQMARDANCEPAEVASFVQSTGNRHHVKGEARRRSPPQIVLHGKFSRTVLEVRNMATPGRRSRLSH